MSTKKSKSKSPLGSARNISRPPLSDEGQDPSDSVNVVEGFNKLAQEGGGVGEPAGPGVRKRAGNKDAREQAQEQGEQDEVSLSGQETDELNFLDKNQLVDMLNLQQRVDAQRLALERDADYMQHMKEAYQRAKQIEDLLEPIRMVEFLSKGFITQRIPIIPDELVVVFRSIPARVDRVVQDLVLEEMQQWENAKLDANSQEGVKQMMRLSVCLQSINGQNWMPHGSGEIYNIIKSRPKDWRQNVSEMILANFAHIDMAESSFVVQLIGQFEAFVMRLRKKLDTVGLQKTVGK